MKFNLNIYKKLQKKNFKNAMCWKNTQCNCTNGMQCIKWDAMCIIKCTMSK